MNQEQPSPPTGHRVRSDTGPFSIIPVWLFEAGVSSGALHLYGVLASYADADGEAYPSRKTLADRLGVSSVRTIDNYRAELVDAGAITIERRQRSDGGDTSSLVTVHRVHPGARGSANPDTTPSADTCTPGTRTRENQSTEANASVANGRKPDPIWDTLVVLFGEPPKAKTARGAWNRVCADLRAEEATPQLVTEVADMIRREWPDITLTPTALAKHYPQFRNAIKVKTAARASVCDECGTGGGFHTYDCPAAHIAAHREASQWQ